jgi:hypothetical protein
MATTLLAALILLVPSVALFIPGASAGPFPAPGSPVSAVTANVGSTVVTAPPFDNSLDLSSIDPALHYSFYAYIDVINVTYLFSYAVGFTFNATYLQVMNVTDGGFLGSAGGTLVGPFYGTIDNIAGEVTYSGAALQGPLKAPTGSGHLLKVGFEINSALSTAGSMVNLMHFNTSADSPDQLSLTYNDSVTDITPTAANIHDGTLTISIVPEFSPMFFAILMVSATCAAAFFTRTKWSRKTQRSTHDKLTQHSRFQ